MEEDRSLRCPEDVESSEGHYDPAGPGAGEGDGDPVCAGCGMPKSAHKYSLVIKAVLEGIYECKGCGSLETKKERSMYEGPLYKDTINDEPYCIRCSNAFYEMKNLPDGAVREDGTFKKPTGLDAEGERHWAPDAD